MRTELIAHIKPEYLEYRLCFIECEGKTKAYFTSDIHNQWGDDWGDAPYEHNAEEPYNHKTDVFSLHFSSDLKTPAQIANGNSPFSVEEINKGETPWLACVRSVKTSESIYSLNKPDEPIHGGATLREFLQHKGIDLVSIPEHILTFGGEV